MRHLTFRWTQQFFFDNNEHYNIFLFINDDDNIAMWKVHSPNKNLFNSIMFYFKKTNIACVSCQISAYYHNTAIYVISSFITGVTWVIRCWPVVICNNCRLCLYSSSSRLLVHCRSLEIHLLDCIRQLRVVANHGISVCRAISFNNNFSLWFV